MTNPAADQGELDRSQADHHKHMEFVQAVVTRLANSSFLMKGWALTLSSAILGFAVTQKHSLLALTAVIPAAAFWLLDTYYLRQERAFRQMYADVATKRVTNFVINSREYAKQQKWCQAAVSVSLAIFYGAIIAVSLVASVILSMSPIHTEKTPVDVHVTVDSGPSPSTAVPQPTTQLPDNREPGN